MKRVLLTVVCSLTLFATPAIADHTVAHTHGALGFHDIAAPVGLRWWTYGQKLAIDLGVGFGSDPSGFDPDEQVSHFAIDAGVPIVMRSWDGVHVMFRPGFLYTSQQVGFDAIPGVGYAFDTDNETTMSLRAEIEAEIFLRDNLTVSASHGIEHVTDQPANTTPGGAKPNSQSSWGTIGRQFTQIGFHIYFLGAHK